MAELAATQSDCVRPMTEADLSLVLSWRNHEDIRRHMFSPNAVTEQEHLGWFERAQSDPGRVLLIFERAGRPVGVANFRCGPHPRVAEWGFYAAPGAPRGTGRALGHAALDHAFEHLGLHKVCAMVMASNPRSIQLHLRLGFAQEGLLREHHFDGSRYQDVLCFGLFAREWRTLGDG